MYLAKKCPCCGNADFQALPAFVSPFIASYVLKTEPSSTRLLECASCTFRFFESRYDEAEVARLYAGYRGDRYFEERHRFEWWYSRKINAAIGKDGHEIGFRNSRLERYLKERAVVGDIHTVLDYGGDRGQFIPAGLGRKRYVLEISAETPVAGVTGVQRASELPKNRSMDLVMLCHVLEHCAEPGAVLADVKRLLGRAGLLYVELPFERYNLDWCARLPFYRNYVDAVVGSKTLLGFIDFYSTVFRVKAGVVPPFGIMKLHEHVNFFNERSLQGLLEKNGFEVEDCRVASNSNKTGVLDSSILCLARPAGPRRGARKKPAPFSRIRTS